LAKRRLDVQLDEREIRQRIERWRAPPPPYESGVLGKYARLVGSAALGAVTA
jgi:dihydroxy-acid dehydratase